MYVVWLRDEGGGRKVRMGIEEGDERGGNEVEEGFLDVGEGVGL